MNACANLAHFLIEKRQRKRFLKSLNTHKLSKSVPDLATLNNAKEPKHKRNNGSDEHLGPPPLPASRPPHAGHPMQENSHGVPVPFEGPPPQAPGTCTLPRRALNRDESSRYRSPSNPPPNSRQPPPYNRPLPPNAPSQRPYLPPPPPRRQEIISSSDMAQYKTQGNENSRLTDEVDTTWRTSSHSNGKDADSGFESIHSRNGELQNQTNFPTWDSKVNGLPSKSTEDLLTASRVSGDPLMMPSQSSLRASSQSQEMRSHVISCDSIYPMDSHVNGSYQNHDALSNYQQPKTPYLDPSHRENRLSSTDVGSKGTNPNDPYKYVSSIKQYQNKYEPRASGTNYEGRTSYSKPIGEAESSNQHSLYIRESSDEPKEGHHVHISEIPEKNNLYVKESITSDRSPDSPQKQQASIARSSTSLQVNSKRLSVALPPADSETDEGIGSSEQRGEGYPPSTSWTEWTHQLQAYVAWVNSQLRKKPGRPLISDLRRDFLNGIVFADLVEIIDVGVGPDIPITAPDKTPCLGRKVISEVLPDEQECSLRRQPSLTQAVRPSSPLYENLPKRASQGRWAYDSLRASHKFSWNSTKSKPTEASNSVDENANLSLSSSSSRCGSLNTSLDAESYRGSPSKSKSTKPAALDFWQRQEDDSPKKREETNQEPCPFKYHTIHRISGRRKLPQIPGKCSPALSNTSRGATPQSMDTFQSSETARLRHSNGNSTSSSVEETSREPEGRSQNSSPATSIVRGGGTDAWSKADGWPDEDSKESITEFGMNVDSPASRNGDGDSFKSNSDSSTLRQEVIRHILARQALESDKVELARSVQQKDHLIADLRKQVLQKEKTLQTQKTQFDEAYRNAQNNKVYRLSTVDNPRLQAREEFHLVREAISALRSNFRDTDPNQHTLDTLEQAIAVLIERMPSGPDQGPTLRKDKHALNNRSESNQTKIIYFTERTVTPFMSTINKRIGDVTLRDFKGIFDRPGYYRFHFKNHDPEYGHVKEEILNDDDVLPGVDGKIIAWVEDDLIEN